MLKKNKSNLLQGGNQHPSTNLHPWIIMKKMWQKVRSSLKIVMLITRILITLEKNILISPPGAVITVTSQHNHYIIPTLAGKGRDKT